MKNTHDLTDIKKVLTEAMNNPIAEAIRSGSIGALGIINPVAGVAVGIGDTLLSEYNIFKLSMLLKGLSKGSDMEKRLNELYNYVNLSPEHAISVSNLLKKTINAECPKVCVIYGLILANHTGDNTEFSQDELIVCKALENATERDLKYFKEIMEKYLKQTSFGNRVTFPEGFVNLNEFTTTCDWGVYNRIFVSRMAEFGELGSETLVLGTHYYETKTASVLMEYINAARKIWDYGEKM